MRGEPDACAEVRIGYGTKRARRSYSPGVEDRMRFVGERQRRGMVKSWVDFGKVRYVLFDGREGATSTQNRKRPTTIAA